MLASPEMVSDGVKRLWADGVVALPTETVYGLAARAESGEAVRTLVGLRGRDEGKPLPVAVSDVSVAEGLVESWPTVGGVGGGGDGVDARALARRFWPGPLTLVLPLKEGVRLPKEVCAGRRTIGLRCPDHPLTLALLEILGEPVVLPSANRPGAPPATSASAVAETFGEAVFVIDGGARTGGTPSTVLDLSGDTPSILRKGALDAETLGLGERGCL